MEIAFTMFARSCTALQEVFSREGEQTAQSLEALQFIADFCLMSPGLMQLEYEACWQDLFALIEAALVSPKVWDEDMRSF